MQRIETLEDMAQVVSEWHSNVVAQISHLAHMPPDMVLEATNEDTGEVVTYSGVLRESFEEGLLTALSIIKKLPFEATSDEA